MSTLESSYLASLSNTWPKAVNHDYYIDLAVAVQTAYGQSHRRYHTLAHLDHFTGVLVKVAKWLVKHRGLQASSTSLFGMDVVRHFTPAEWFTLLLALGGHDAVYEPFAPRGHNEALSLAWSKRVYAPLAGHYDPDLLAACINVTVDHKPGSDWRVKLFSMADMAIFLAPEDDYKTYRDNVLEEYTGGTTVGDIERNSVAPYNLAAARAYLAGRCEWLQATFGVSLLEQNNTLAEMFGGWPLPEAPEPCVSSTAELLAESGAAHINDEIAWLNRLSRNFTQTA